MLQVRRAFSRLAMITIYMVRQQYFINYSQRDKVDSPPPRRHGNSGLVSPILGSFGTRRGAHIGTPALELLQNRACQTEETGMQDCLLAALSGAFLKSLSTHFLQRAKQQDRAMSFQLLNDLRLRPEEFPSFLCDTLGFRLLRRLQPSEAASGFSRLILVLRRP